MKNASHRARRTCAVLVRGLDDVASAVAYTLFLQGQDVAIHNEAEPPKVHRRGMAFTDAFFEGEAILNDVLARRCDTALELFCALRDRLFIPVLVGDPASWLDAHPWDVVVDARMRKRTKPQPACGIAPLTIGLGPGHVAGETADIAVETCWGDRLGAVVSEGPTLAYTGVPNATDGTGRARYVYSPAAGVLHSERRLGDIVSAGIIVATVDETPIRAPLSGTLRGLVHPGVSVEIKDKIIEVDPRPPGKARVRGIGERPARIASGVAAAISHWKEERA